MWGSHVYTRFSPCIIESHLNQLSTAEIIDWNAIVDTLDPKITTYAAHFLNIFSWDNIVRPFRLPPGLQMRLADLDAGSSTPKLVGAVLNWKKSDPGQGSNCALMPMSSFRLVSAIRKGQ